MSPEKSPRQPRKPFQNLAKKERTTRPERKSTGRSEGRMEKPYKPRPKEDRPPRPFLKKDRPKPSGEENERSERRKPVKKVIEKKSHASHEPGSKYATKGGRRIVPGAYEPEGIRLNRYIANSGVCSRREADQMIQAGVIKVNGQVVSTLGTKVMPGDKVQYGDQTLSNEAKRYLLLNKQKGYVTTTKDPHAKNTVMELIAGACKERIYPVGRLDRNTTGLLLFTNDGELAKKLMHPRSKISKLYHVVLDQPLAKANLLKVAQGVELDGEMIEIDGIEYVEDANDRRELGMTIHSGQNRVIRRIFELFGHKVVKLDRVIYAGLTKKNLPRGTWRFLNDREVMELKKLR